MNVLSLALGLLKALAGLVPLAFSYLAGRRGAENKGLRDDAAAQAQARRVRDRLRHDREYADRVRDRFDG